MIYETLCDKINELSVRHCLPTSDLEIRIVLNKADKKSLVDYANQSIFNFPEGVKSFSDFMDIVAINIHGLECKVFYSINDKSYVVCGKMASVPVYKFYGTKRYETGTELKWQTTEMVELTN